MKRGVALIALIALITLTACQSDRNPGDPPAAELRQSRAACEADGGSFQRGGLLQQYFCRNALPDAGQACSTSAECVGFCMADTRTCQAEGPIFGCFAYIEDDGETVEICID
ncbi:hypothetical protein [Aliiroseovarius subalbicans]|uniref:hypothetical protein n=1 Tax=Aliiroseovarius subalbicans TaxID=2925840 RepID=UPI001F5A2F57|nr:hypothetical protein [Aliiroseovarius subalbicans]MCI2398053.1 hypothetical protein [Aliiroseovarius subalbicans]